MLVLFGLGAQPFRSAACLWGSLRQGDWHGKFTVFC